MEKEFGFHYSRGFALLGNPSIFSANPQHATHMAQHRLPSCIRDQMSIWRSEDDQANCTTGQQWKEKSVLFVPVTTTMASLQTEPATQQMEKCGFEITEWIILSSVHRPQIWISKKPEVFHLNKQRNYCWRSISEWCLRNVALRCMPVSPQRSLT